MRNRRDLTRREFIGTGAAGALGLSVGPLSPLGASMPLPRAAGKGASGAAPRAPNLVVLVADQLNRQHCGFAGYEQAYTPNIDRLAREGVDFEQAVSGHPLCCPFRASLYTGKYSSSTGMVLNELRAMPDPDAFAHVLEENGYRTVHIGKWHLFGKDHSPPQQFCPPGPYRLGFDGEWKSYNFNHENYEAFYYGDTFERVEIDGFGPHQFTTLAIDALRRASAEEQPFALFLHYSLPHDPWTWENNPESFNHLFRDAHAPDPPNYRDEGHALYWSRARGPDWYANRFRPNRFQYRRVYDAMTAALDWNVGRVLNALDDVGVADETAVVFTSDHGEMFGAHGRVAKNIFYEESVRVPFLLRLPGRTPSGLRTDAALNTPDIMPTLLGLLGLPVPASAEGMDLSGEAVGRGGPRPEAALMQGMGHIFQWTDGYEWRALRDARYTYAVERAEGKEHLYDHVEDRYQLRNLVDDPAHRGELGRFRDMLRARLAALNDTFEATTWYREHWTEDRVIVRSATRELEPEYRPENIPLPHISAG